MKSAGSESAGGSRELESPVGDLIGWVLVGSRLGNEELDDQLDNFDLDEANQDRDSESPVKDLEFRCLKSSGKDWPRIPVRSGSASHLFGLTGVSQD